MNKAFERTEIARTGAAIHVTGIVQGVGFRPFVYNLASRFDLTGWVRNTSAGVDIRVDGTPQAIDAFTTALRTEAPALALIDQLAVKQDYPLGLDDFQILQSAALPEEFQPISPDVSICPECLAELFDPLDRRYLYPFINCTNCGPRFTIIRDIPYDRPKTTMSGFEICPACAEEYSDPHNRRFHAQPIACPDCGPKIWLEFGGRKRESQNYAMAESRRLLAEGRILAIKGLGGFHLACDATNSDAVSELRRRKLRVDKPFALMMADLSTIDQHCMLSEAEIALLTGRERPIVVLSRKPGSEISPDVAPGQETLGVMLPYTPLHYLLFANLVDALNSSTRSALVMTSGNLSEEPIAWENAEASRRLSTLADGFLMHDRPIHTRCDDSVVRIVSIPQVRPSRAVRETSTRSMIFTRRSRGYAPTPILLRDEVPQILATGAELKNTFCLTRERYALLSHHIGDLENFETLRAYEEGIQHFERLFRVLPECLAYDLHPDYLATRYALERSDREDIPAYGVQHHHAHIVACMAEHHLPVDQTTIGISFDGTGYGQDGAIWGGEFLTANYQDFQRLFHLDYVPLPGGDRAVREPYRMALAWLFKADIEWEVDLPPVAFCAQYMKSDISTLGALRRQLESGFNAPPTSSMGRLFDAAAALIGLRQIVNYEAQAAIELEAQADTAESGSYPFNFTVDIVDPAPVIAGLVDDLRNGRSVPFMAARFHNTVAAMVCRVAEEIRRTTGFNQVVLSGGVWQNMLLLSKSIQLLEKGGFGVIVHRQIPPNDGGIALGQAMVAAHRFKSGIENSPVGEIKSMGG